ncbi:MAG: thiamine-phosphate kinase [Chloroflexi bacterium]|nr:thiamine-phosphate kinase [Chloroflexota bacterium]
MTHVIISAMMVSELGEFGLIDLLAEMVASSQDKRAASWQQLILGIGDDAAAWKGSASIQLATVDTLIQDVHFSLNTATWRELGWKALAVNLSDIAAMGGLPGYALVALSLPGHTPVEDVTELYRGMIELARQHGVAIVGGNVSSAPLVTITITVIGVTGRDGRLLTRSSARAGEQVAVTGQLGTAAAGLEMLTRRLRFDPETTACLRSAFFCPQPRIAEGRLLAAQGVKAAIDISDGLVSDLHHICRASLVGARINVDAVPIQPAVKASLGDKALQLALAGGEDYELLFTASAGVVERAQKLASCPVTVIGEIVPDKAGEVSLVDREGQPFTLPNSGWEHFAKPAATGQT